MDVLPVRAPLVPRSAVARPARAPAKAAAPKIHDDSAPADEVHPSAHVAARPGAHTAPAGPEDVALLAQQAAFNQMMQVRAELQREANALRDLAMEQVKRDDSVMNQWIKLI